MMPCNFKYFPIFAILAGVLSFGSAAHADNGLTATGNTLPIGANGTTVLTITGGSSPSAAFSTNAIVYAPAGVNINNNDILYSTGGAFFSGNTIVSGNVGIGVSSPAAALDVVSVVGDTGAIHTYTGSVGQLASGVENDGGNIWIGGNSDFTFDGGTDSDFWFNNSGTIDGATAFRWDGDSSHAGQFNLYIKNSGNVGIGTITPQNTLDVENTTNNAKICLNGNCTANFAPQGCHIVTKTGVGSNPYGNNPGTTAATNNYVSDARCASNEYVMSGGGVANNWGTTGICPAGTPASIVANSGYIHTNVPDGDLQGWTVDAYSPTGEVCTAAYAVCCPK